MKEASNEDQSGRPSLREEEIYEFEGLRLDAAEKILFQRGQPVPLTAKALDTLIALVRRHGSVVSKHELLQAVWPGTFVEEGVLAQNILTLRKALNADWIETVPRRGYRLSATVTRTAGRTAGAAVSRSRMWIWWAASVLLMGSAALIPAVVSLRAGRAKARAGSAPIRSLAVLPFHSISPDTPYLGLGLADVLINRLSTLPRITVRPTSAIRKFGDAATDPVTAGRQLGVDAVLEGNLQRDGDRVRATVRLLRMPDGASLWTGQFDERVQDLFTLEDSIAGPVANGLVLDLTASERERVMRRYTGNAEAWQAYLRGRYLWDRRTPETHQKAIEEFEKATHIDDRYALAYAGLADAYALLGSNPNRVMPRAEAMAKARAAALKAIDLDGDLAEAHTALAFILMHYDWKPADAEQEFQRALSLNPSYATAHQWHAMNLLVAGRQDDAIQELKNAQTLDPASPIIMADRAEMYIYTGRLDEAVTESRRVLELDPSFSLARVWLAWALSGQRRFEEAAAILGQRQPEGDPSQLSALAYLYAASGRKAEARRTADRIGRQAQQDFGLSYLVASAYASLGDVDAMLPWLEKAFAERTGGLLLLNVHPMFAAVREDPRFQAFVARTGLPPLRK
jgi:DNA-binding winged helix-turn-helix (wHTH) protein/TolB-like protein/tetratricopeptide (TPR) repeat protein